MIRHIILDLDQTLICAEDTQQDTKTHGAPALQSGKYMIWPRPGLENFLDYIFTNYRVSVWTAASLNYAKDIISKLILTKPERNLFLFLWDEHTQKCEYDTGVQKSLNWLSERYNLDLRTTIIIDDRSDIYNFQPDRCINIKPWYLTKFSNYDQELEIIKSYLLKLHPSTRYL